MCHSDPEQPYHLVLGIRRQRDDSIVATYTFPLGKVTSFRNREHYSGQGFLWPIGQTVHDPNAKQGAHGSCLHFTASGASAFNPGFSSYGSHPLVVVPAPQLWDDPFGNAGLTNRCWHSVGGTILFCAACLNLKPEDLKNPEFWHDITIPKRRRRFASATDDFFDLRIPRNAVWHREEKVELKTA
jgi:hypothetical protein